MNLTPNMRMLLVAILEEIRRLEAVPDRPPGGMDWERWRTFWLERKEYEQFGVRHDLARWLGHTPSPSESAVFSRALRNMEAMGLLLRVNCYGGGRATHVQLTDEGRMEAERLVAHQEAATAVILKGLVPLPGPIDGAPKEGQDSTGN